MDRIGILIQLMGNEKAIRDLETLAKFEKQLNNGVIDIRVKSNNIDKELDKIKHKIDITRTALEQMNLNRSQLKKGSYGYDLWTKEIERVKQALINLEKQQDEVEKRKRASSRELGSQQIALQAVKQQISELKKLEQEAKRVEAEKAKAAKQAAAEQEKAARQAASAQKKYDNERLQAMRQIDSYNRKLRSSEETLAKTKGVVNTSELEKYIALIRQLRDELSKTYGIDKNYTTYSDALSRTNQQYREAIANAKTLRDVMSSAGQWFSTVGSGLQSIGGIFNTDILSYITQTLTQMGTSAVMNNLGKAATRWDTLSTYAPYMEAIGISAERANASLSEVDQVIQGLPIGLDEAALDIRRTSMLLGNDLETATKFVEGFDQALIAGGAPEQMRHWSYIEMQRLLTSGKLNQSRQWMSLVQGLGVSIPYLKNAMGYGDLTQAEFEANLFEGAYTGEEVIKGFAAMADDPELQKLIEIYKGTIESGLSNLRYAMARGLQKTFDAFNEVALDTTGMGISDYLLSGRDFIDRAFEGIADWVRKNPDTITGILDQIEGLANRAEKFDWGKLASSIIGSIQSIVDIATWIYDHVPEPVIRGFLTFSMVWATPLGKAFSALGNFFTTLAYLPFPKLGALTKGMSNMGRFVGSLKSVGQGFLGASAYIGIIAEIGLVIYELTKVAEAVAHANLDGFWKNFGKIAGFGSILTGIGTALTTVFSAISAIPGGALVVGAGELLSAGFVGIIAEIGAVVYEFTKVAEAIATAKLPNANKISQVFGIIQSIATGIKDTDLRLGTKWKTKSITRMIDMLEGLSDAIPALENISNANIDTTKLEGTVKSVLGAYEAIDSTIEGFFGEFENRTNLRMNSWQNSKIVENIASVIEDLGTTIDALGGIEEKLNEYGLFASPNGDHNVTLERMRVTFMDILKIGNEINNLVSEWKGPILTKFKEIKTSMEDEIIKNYNEAIQSIADVITTIQSNKETFSSVMVGHGHNRTMAPEFYQAKESIKEVLEAISNDDGTGMLDGIYESALALGRRIENQDWAGIANITTNMDTAMSKIASIFDTIKTYSTKMQWISGDTRSRTSFSETVENFNSLVSGLNQINLESINGMNTDNLVANSENILIAMNRVAGVVQTLETNAASFAKANEEGGSVYQFKKMLNELITALSGNGGTISAANYTAMATAIDTLQTALSGIANVNLGNVSGDIKDMAKNVKDLAQKAKDGAKYLNDLRDKIIAAAGAANSNSNKFSGLVSSLKKIADNASSAYANLYNLASIVNSFTDKTINININTNGLEEAIARMRVLNALTNAGNAVNNVINGINSTFRGIFSASGGKVNYLAKGGMPMKPRGTDTVPAMLTPGEWVINRRASKAFGDNFMRKINNMDIPGAMDALMQRSKWIPNGGVYYTTNNYNNQSVTQNFSKEKDSKTSYRRANRYLGAL